MSVELQIRDAAMAALASHILRHRLRSKCLPQLPEDAHLYIDHVDVISEDATVETKDGKVQLSVPMHVFLVTEDALRAAVNEQPVGAANAAMTSTVSFEVKVTLNPMPENPGDASILARIDFVPLALDPDPAQLGPKFFASIGKLSHDLTPLLSTFGVTAVAHGDVVLVDHVVVTRFDPAGPAQARLSEGQEWGAFVDGPTLASYVRAKVAAKAEKKFPDATTTASYAMVGTAPRVNARVDNRISIANVGFDTSIDFPFDFSLAGTSTPVLRATCHWSVHVYGDGLLGFGPLESLAESYADDHIDPSDFGTQIGDHTFIEDTTLPATALEDVWLSCDGIIGAAAGMIIGGVVVIPKLLEPQFSVKVYPLGGPTRIQLCSHLARSGSGAPSHEPLSVFNTKSYGAVEISGCGALCECDIEMEYASFTSMPPTEIPLEDFWLRVAMPYVQALKAGQSCSMVIRTPRGVRFVDLGRAPEPQTDSSGALIGVLDTYIPDCLYVTTREKGRYGIGWGSVSVGSIKPPPLEDPDWTYYLSNFDGFVMKLISASGLKAGDLLQFRSRDYSVDAAADARGTVIIPVIFPLATTLPPSVMTRADGQTLAGHLTIESVTFERHLTLAGTLLTGLTAANSGHMLFSTRSHGRASLHAVGELGALTSNIRTAHDEMELNQHALPSHRQSELLLESLRRAGVRGVERVEAIPGFAERGVSVAMTSGGDKLLINVDESGNPRVAGKVYGPLEAVSVEGGWAVASLSNAVAVFKVSATSLFVL